MSRFPTAILLGVVIYGCLSLLAFFTTLDEGAPWPSWYGTLRSVSDALLAVAPGFAAGWFAGRSGWAVGSAVGVLVTITSLAIVCSWWGAPPMPALASSLIFGTIANVITQSVAGAAGAATSASWTQTRA